MAALALGSLGDEKCVEPLRETYFTRKQEGYGEADPLESALISALGEVPCPRSAGILTEILAGEVDAVCYGSLAQRNPVSGKTICRFLETTKPECSENKT